MCRGNFRSSWVAEGGYDFVAEALFGELGVDGFFLEYDDARSGGFEPLRFVPKGKLVVLGLVTTKRGELEDKDELKRRIEEAEPVRRRRPALPVAAVRVLVDGRGQQRDLRRAGGEAAPDRRGRRRGLGLSGLFDVEGLGVVVTGAASGLGLRDGGGDGRRRRAGDPRGPRRGRSGAGGRPPDGRCPHSAGSTSPTPTPWQRLFDERRRGAGRSGRRVRQRRHLARGRGASTSAAGSATSTAACGTPCSG